MSLPASTRYLVIRDALYALLHDHANLSTVVTWCKELHSFAEVQSAGAFPIVAVVLADQISDAAWNLSGGTRDYHYRFEIHVAVMDLTSPQTCQDSLLQYLEAIENILQSDQTWGGSVTQSWGQTTEWLMGRDDKQASYIAAGVITLEARARKL